MRVDGKVCRKCGEWKERRNFKSVSWGEGRSHICRACLISPRARQAERRRAAQRAGRPYRTREQIMAHKEARQAARQAARARRIKVTEEERYRRWLAYDKARRVGLKARARRMLQGAVARGAVRKPSRCDVCRDSVPRRRLHGHHEDYSKPLDVLWLCPRCHGLRHRNGARREAAA